MKALKTSRRNQVEMLSRRQQHDNNATFIFVIVCVVSFTCQLPAFINVVILESTSLILGWPSNLGSSCGGYEFYLNSVTNALVLLNSAVNTIIYAVFNKRFRHVLTRTVCGSRRIKNGGQWHKSTGNHPHVKRVTTSADNDNAIYATGI